MTIKTAGLRGVMLATPDIARSSRFYREVWGLADAGSDDHGRVYFGSGAGDWMLALEASESASLARLCFELGSEEAVVTAARTLARAGVDLTKQPQMLAGPVPRFGLVFCDPDGRAVELSWAEQEIANVAARAPSTPSRLSHVVLNSRRAGDIRDFYIDRLGFTLSDWYADNMLIFLRCNADHHCLAFGQGTNDKINHIAFLVDDVDAVMQAMSRVKVAGYGAVWGPGRHGPGGNVFCYFEDPAGFVVEFTADVIQIAENEDWMPREWARTPQNGNIWGTGGPNARAVALMSGEQIK